MAVAKITDNFDRALNPHPNPTDFEHEIRIRWMQILAGSVTSLYVMLFVFLLFSAYDLPITLHSGYRVLFQTRNTFCGMRYLSHCHTLLITSCSVSKIVTLPGRVY